MKQYRQYGFSLLIVAGLTVTPSAQAIQKCKDADGKWHYGDNAEENCTTTEVTTLTERGFIKETIDAPKTEEEKQAEAELAEKEALAAAKRKSEQEERDRILSIYEREEDIDRQRDNQLASVDGNIRVHKAYLKQMDSKIKRLEDKSIEAKGKRKEAIEKELFASKSRVEEFTAELARLEEQRVSISEKFASEKKLYRELTKK